MLDDIKYHHSKILQTVLDVKGLNKCVGEKWNTQKISFGNYLKAYSYYFINIEITDVFVAAWLSALRHCMWSANPLVGANNNP